MYPSHLSPGIYFYSLSRLHLVEYCYSPTYSPHVYSLFCAKNCSMNSAGMQGSRFWRCFISKLHVVTCQNYTSDPSKRLVISQCKLQRRLLSHIPWALCIPSCAIEYTCRKTRDTLYRQWSPSRSVNNPQVTSHMLKIWRRRHLAWTSPRIRAPAHVHCAVLAVRTGN